jgi:hypothetical protein
MTRLAKVHDIQRSVRAGACWASGRGSVAWIGEAPEAGSAVVLSRVRDVFPLRPVCGPQAGRARKGSDGAGSR